MINGCEANVGQAESSQYNYQKSNPKRNTSIYRGEYKVSMRDKTEHYVRNNHVQPKQPVALDVHNKQQTNTRKSTKNEAEHQETKTYQARDGFTW